MSKFNLQFNNKKLKFLFLHLIFFQHLFIVQVKKYFKLHQSHKKKNKKYTHIYLTFFLFFSYQSCLCAGDLYQSRRAPVVMATKLDFFSKFFRPSSSVTFPLFRMKRGKRERRNEVEHWRWC